VLDLEALLRQVESSAYKFLKQKGVIESKEFDNSLHAYASWEDISDDLIKGFLELANEKRDFPLGVESTKQDVLAHLGVSREGQLFNSALLIFTDHPQRYFPAATVKCAYFHGHEVSKPIPDLREYEGTVLEQSANATDFVLSKISRKTGDRSQSNRVDTSYEIPRTVVAEAIINAIAHRDYQSTASIQVSVFKDRVEIWNPGALPPGLTIDRLKEAHGSFPRNPLLAKCLFNTGDIERYGTGTKEIFDTLDNEFRVVLWRAEAGGTAGGMTGGTRITQVAGYERLTARQKELLKLLMKNNRMTYDEMAESLGVKSRTSAQKLMEKLKETGSVSRGKGDWTIHFRRRRKKGNNEVTPQKVDTSEKLRSSFGVTSEKISNDPAKNMEVLVKKYGAFIDFAAIEMNTTSEKLRSNFGVTSDDFRSKFGDNKALLLFLIAVEPQISAVKAAERIGVSDRTVETYISHLKGKYLDRVGSDKEGHWIITIR